MPEEFEWIRTKRRLIKEKEMQHHCVASYADDINNDRCAIYSFIYLPEEMRYTLEFIKQGSEYKLVQMQKKYNKGHSAEARKYVNDQLKNKKSVS
jgi:hypothetical protein